MDLIEYREGEDRFWRAVDGGRGPGGREDLENLRSLKKSAQIQFILLQCWVDFF